MQYTINIQACQASEASISSAGWVVNALLFHWVLHLNIERNRDTRQCKKDTSEKTEKYLLLNIIEVIFAVHFQKILIVTCTQ